jgi:DNA-binding transcriptional LysR family regulator
MRTEWPAIELRHLAALRAIAEAGSFRAAAARLGYTQSAVSQQIAVLEKVVGTQLVVRPGGPRRVSLTEAGLVLLRHAEAVVARLRAAEADVRALAAGDAGALQVGTFQSVGARILPTVLQRFATTRPGVQVQVRESTSDPELLELVESGELDLTFAMLPLPPGPFEVVDLMRDDWVLLVQADSDLAARGSLPIAELAELPLIGPRLCRSGVLLEARFGEAGVAPGYVFHSDENSTVHALVAAGVGVALVPELSADPKDERVAVLRLEPALSPRTIALVWHRDRYRSPAAEAFVALARAVCCEVAAGASAERLVARHAAGPVGA